MHNWCASGATMRYSAQFLQSLRVLDAVELHIASRDSPPRGSLTSVYTSRSLYSTKQARLYEGGAGNPRGVRCPGSPRPSLRCSGF
jgi:hypothetical protein